MLYSIGRVDDLKKYIDEKKDLSLRKWWANYCEAQNLLQDAIEQYKLVRLLEKTEEPLCIS
jgi:DNA-binding transcriptional regulator GbsR (MarR family)